MAFINSIAGAGALPEMTATGTPIAVNGLVGSGGVWGAVSVNPSGKIIIPQAGRSIVSQVDLGTDKVTTVVGSGQPGWTGDGGDASLAGLINPQGVAYDSAGNMFIADTNNQVIRRVDAVTGVITTVAGNGISGYGGDGGAATSAMLKKPRKVVVDSNDDLLIADTDNNRIRKVDMGTGIITTVCGTGAGGTSGNGGAATAATISFPYGIAIDLATDDYYVISWDKENVRKVDGTTGIITQFAGNNTAGFSGDGGAATAAKLNRPTDVAINAAATKVYIADQNNERVRVVDTGTGIITTYAGTGTAGFSGDGGAATAAKLNKPKAVAVDASGNLFIMDSSNYACRMVTLGTGVITTIMGTGASPLTTSQPMRLGASLGGPYGIGYSPDYSKLYISANFQNRILVADLATRLVTLLAGTGAVGYTGDGGPATAATFGSVYMLAVGPITGNVYVADLGNNVVRVINTTTGVISTYAGTGAAGDTGDGGAATAATMTSPIACVCDASENLYISAFGNKKIRKVDYGTGIISTFAGNGTSGPSGMGGAATAAGINSPYQCSITPDGTKMFVASRLNHQIYQIVMGTGIISLAAGVGTSGFSGDGGAATAAELAHPRGVGASNTHFYISDNSNFRVRRVSLGTGVIDTYAGSGSTVPIGDGGDALDAGVIYPIQSVMDKSGVPVFCSYLFDRVRRIAESTGANQTIVVV